MKKILLTLISLLIAVALFSQPDMFKYQAVLRDATGNVQASKNVTIVTSILQSTITGTVVYSESHATTTTAQGIVNLNIGGGTVVSGNISSIDWSVGPYFIKIAVDGTEMGTSQLLSVPYALYAKMAGNGFSGKYDDLSNKPTIVSSEVDPLYAASVAKNIKSADTTRWSSKSNFSGNYNDLSNKPALFDSKYSSLTGKPAIWDSSWASIKSTPANIDVDKTDDVMLSGNQTIAGDKTFSNKIFVTQQGIGTTTPNASAALEISSTTLGFLPPRMTLTQRTAITPVEGLMIYNLTSKSFNYFDGAIWRYLDGTSAVLAIGDKCFGGIIAYIFQPGDAGYVAGQTHGLIIAPSDQSDGMQWYNGSYTLTGASGTAIGTGNANTNTIVTSQGGGIYAAKLCSDLIIDGYSDWYLPSKDELNKFSINYGKLNFNSFPYWSSSEIDSNNAWYSNIPALPNIGSKNALGYVRAIRSF